MCLYLLHCVRKCSSSSESLCALRTQSDLSGSPDLFVSARLHTQTVLTQTILFSAAFSYHSF